MPFHEYNDLLEAFIDPELACAAGALRGSAPPPIPARLIVGPCGIPPCWSAPPPPALARVANTQLDEVAGTLVNIFAINSRVRQFVRTLTTIEILQTSERRRARPPHVPAQPFPMAGSRP